MRLVGLGKWMLSGLGWWLAVGSVVYDGLCFECVFKNVFNIS